MDEDIQWVESYAVDDCVDIASSEEAIREHAFRAPIPADRVLEIKRVVDPTLAEVTS